MCSVIEPDTSIRQNITACATGFGMRLEPPVAHVQRIDIGDHAGAAQLARQLLLQLQPPRLVLAVGARARRSPRAAPASSSGFGRRSAMRRDRLFRTVRFSARLAGEPVTE